MGLIKKSKKTLVLSDEQLVAVDSMCDEGYDLVFLTGKAGTGKSTVIGEYIKRRKREGIKVLVLGSTGIAALNVKGVTVHSFFDFRIGGLNKGYRKKMDAQKFEGFDELIIDEISMVRVDLMNAILLSLRSSAKKENRDRLAGGKRLVMVGDLAQLPPIVINNCHETKAVLNDFKGIYFFHALTGVGKVINKVELTGVFRQSDDNFKKILDDFRDGNPSIDSISAINKRLDRRSEDAVVLATTRKKVDDTNEDRLSELDGKGALYRGLVKNKFSLEYPSPMELRLKKGARVMFVSNKTDSGEFLFANGEMGFIEKLESKDGGGNKYIVVRKDNGDTVRVYKHKWEHLSYKMDGGEMKTNKLGSYTQYPLKLGWAVTIHKSQGLSLPRIHIDVGTRGCFTHGQLYVALSRCNSLEGISLERKVSYRDIIFDRVLKPVVS